jgi:hypothetical protein
MDTRFWGPSGWRLLHSISFSPEVDLAAQREFFTLLAYVLPCKFCRASYSDYITEFPFPAPASRAEPEDVAHWLWKIHNCVNAKLRSQGFTNSGSPTFVSVRRVYTDRLAAGCSRIEFEGWEFLFAIAENHPFSRSMAGSSADVGERSREDVSDFEQNRANMLAPSIRMKYYRSFWELLPSVLPFKEWTAVWKAAPALSVDSRVTLLRSLWRVRHTMEKELALLNREKFQSLCKRLVQARSKCGRKKRARTCRRSRQGTSRRRRSFKTKI